MKKPKAVDYANQVLSFFKEEIPKKYWKDVLYLVNEYIKYYLEEGYKYDRKKRQPKSF